MPVRYYADGPCRRFDEVDLGDLRSTDAAVIVNYFGWRGSEFAALASSSAQLIEDHSHDPDGPWPRSSSATFCFASLRKSLPLPDGAAVWSPAGLPLPPPAVADPDHLRAVALKLQGMALKALYLQGAGVTKERYRDLLLAGEPAMLGASRNLPAASDAAGALLGAISATVWRRARLRNYRFLAASGRIPARWWAIADLVPGTCPFSLILLAADEAQRDRVRDELIRQRVYTPVLWKDTPADDVKAVDFAARMISVPCDRRYGRNDMLKLLDILQPVLEREKR